MNCPELTSLTKAAANSADPALSRHLQECAVCRRDLEIAVAVSEFLYPDTEVPAHLNARVMARVRARAARLMERAGPAGPLFLRHSGRSRRVCRLRGRRWRRVAHAEPACGDLRGDRRSRRHVVSPVAERPGARAGRSTHARRTA